MSSSMRDDDGIWKHLLESKQQLREEEEDSLSPEESERLAAAVHGKGDEDADAPVTAEPGLDMDDELGGEDEEAEHDLSATGDDPHGDESEEQLNAGVMDTLNPGLGVAKDMGSGGLLKVTGVTEEEPPGLPPVDSVPPTGEEPDRPPVGSNAHKIDGDIHKEVEDRLKELMAAGIDREEAMSMAMDQTNSRYKNNPNISVGNKLTRDSFEVRTTMKTVTEEFVRRNQNIRHYSVRQAIEAETARRLGLDQLDEFSTGSTHGGKTSPMLMASNKKKLEEWVPAAAAVAGAVAPMLMGSNKKKLEETGKFGAGKDHRNVHTDTKPGEVRGYPTPDDMKGIGKRVHPVDISQGERRRDHDQEMVRRGARPAPDVKHIKAPSTAYTPDQSKGLRGGKRGEHPKQTASRRWLQQKKEPKHVGTSTSVPGEAANYMAEDDDTPLKVAKKYDPHPDEKDIDSNLNVRDEIRDAQDHGMDYWWRND